ncbi:MAG: hypothetical protein AAGC56_11355 [Pseudomonadota bacterium]
MAKEAGRQAGDGVREAIAQLEQRIDALATALMGTEEFAKTANAASNLQLRVQQGLSGHMARQLALFNMPSREDVASIGSRLMVIDERLERIEERLKAAAPETAPARPAGPPRTRKPPSANGRAQPATKASAKAPGARAGAKPAAKKATKAAPAKKAARKAPAKKRAPRKAAKPAAAAQ